MNVRTLFHQHRFDIVACLALLVLAGLPRLLDLGTYLTVDEKNWIGRSYEFVRAFKDFRFNDMLQTTHPGVTTMWMAGAAIVLKIQTSHIPFSFSNLVHFVRAAQLPIALTTTILIPVTYLFLKRLFNSRRLALLTTVFLAFDPFLIGYSRVVHVDALLAHWLFLAAVATMIYARENYSRRWLVVSAILAGLAILTKAPAVFTIPFLILVVLTNQSPRALQVAAHDRLRDLIIWALIIMVIFVAFWPAILWVPNPEGNILVLKRDLSFAAITPHHAVEDYTLNGAHYLFTLLTRTTPVTLLGAFVSFVILASVTWFANRSAFASELTQFRHRRVWWWLVAYIGFFIIMMTLGAKKGDRYILPVWPGLTVLAAAAVWWGADKASVLVNTRLQRKPRQAVQMSWALAALTCIYLVITLSTYHPYAIAYSNPFFPSNLSQEVGWGEGLEQVANWLNKEAPQAVVASWYPEELGAYTTAHVAHINAHEQGKVQFVVLYHNMFGRAPDHYANDFIDEYFKKRQPVFVAKVAGEDFAWVYEKPVYEQVVGELVPGQRVQQGLEVVQPNVVGVDLLLATYLGKATQGQVVIAIKAEPTGVPLHQWQIPVSTIVDDGWLSLKFPEVLSAPPAELYVEIWAEGTVAGNAPTIRYARRRDVRPGNFRLADRKMLTAADEKQGDLALRLRYRLASGAEATENDTKLLEH